MRPVWRWVMTSLVPLDLWSCWDSHWPSCSSAWLLRPPPSLWSWQPTLQWTQLSSRLWCSIPPWSRSTAPVCRSTTSCITEPASTSLCCCARIRGGEPILGVRGAEMQTPQSLQRPWRSSSAPVFCSWGWCWLETNAPWRRWDSFFCFCLYCLFFLFLMNCFFF